jgi:hypothetical protein
MTRRRLLILAVALVEGLLLYAATAMRDDMTKSKQEENVLEAFHKDNKEKNLCNKEGCRREQVILMVQRPNFAATIQQNNQMEWLTEYWSAALILTSYVRPVQGEMCRNDMLLPF